MERRSLPSNGFIGLLTGHDPFDLHFCQIAVKATVRLGLFPEIDMVRLRHTREVWAGTIVDWLATLKGASFKEVSHIKMAGALLWSFVQEECCPVDAVVPLAARHQAAVAKYGAQSNIAELRPGWGEIYQASPNPSLGYVFVTEVFDSLQRSRGVTRDGINFDDPPMTYHYFHNLCCWYLVEQNPSKEDLYMIYKTMDLFALKLPSSEGRPRR